MTLAQHIRGTILSGIYYLNSHEKNPTTKPFILCYHSISNDPWRFSTSPSIFEDQLTFLKRNYHVVSLSDFINAPPDSHNLVSLTFDDGYQDFYSTAAPILNKLHLPATVFVIADKSRVSKEELANPKFLMTDSQLKQLHQQGFEIGFHTATHPSLRQLGDSSLFLQIVKSKNDLERKLGFSINYFAYPKGFYSKKVLKYVTEGKFAAGFTIDGGSASNYKNRLLIPRIGLEGKLTPHQFSAQVSNTGLSFEKYFMALLKAKEQIMPTNYFK